LPPHLGAVSGFDVKDAKENKRLLGLVRDLLIMEKEP